MEKMPKHQSAAQYDHQHNKSSALVLDVAGWNKLVLGGGSESWAELSWDTGIKQAAITTWLYLGKRIKKRCPGVPGPRAGSFPDPAPAGMTTSAAHPIR